MSELKKILVCPYFGDFPEWMDKFEPPKGYDWLLDTDIDKFKQRVKDKLGIDYPGVYGSGKVWDYRCALGLLYEEEIKGYDFWGHCDFDVAFGDMDKFVPDELLNTLDVYSGHNEYVNGCFSLYRNCDEVNRLFLSSNWRYNMSTPTPTGWVEAGFSRTLEQSGLRYKYDFPQGNPWTKELNLKKENGRLYQNGNEIGFFHFRHFKYWPL